MNKKGQVLIAFVLLLPVLFMFMGLIIDCGYLYLEKRNIDNNIKDVIKYGLKNNLEEQDVLESKIKKQLNLNIENIDKLNIILEDSTIEIELTKRKKGIFTLIFSRGEYLITSHYKGRINDREIKIRKV